MNTTESKNKQEQVIWEGQGRMPLFYMTQKYPD